MTEVAVVDEVLDLLCAVFPGFFEVVELKRWNKIWVQSVHEWKHMKYDNISYRLWQFLIEITIILPAF